MERPHGARAGGGDASVERSLGDRGEQCKIGPFCIDPERLPRPPAGGGRVSG